MKFNKEQDELDKLDKAWSMLDNYPVPKLRDDFTPSLMKKIHENDAKIIRVKYRLPRFLFRPLVPVLGSVLIAIVTIALFFERPAHEKIPGQTVPLAPVSTEGVAGDKDIIQNLDVLENVELLKNMKLLNELDVVMNLNESAS